MAKNDIFDTTTVSKINKYNYGTRATYNCFLIKKKIDLKVWRIDI